MYLDTLSWLAIAMVLGITALLIVNSDRSVTDRLHSLFRHRARRPYHSTDE
jgi:hypothetical protein